MEGKHLERYAARFPAVEINSTFYRSHKPQTYAKWAASVPEHFRFAVKVPREITHTHRLTQAELLDKFLDEIDGLGRKLGPLLIQLPPSLQFNASIAGKFFSALRERFVGAVVCEPRHASWFADEVDRHLASYHVARVAADPACIPQAANPGGWNGLVYYRLHGSPRMYYSSYSAEYLYVLIRKLVASACLSPRWCIFDNTASGAALENGLAVLEQLQSNKR